MRPVLETLVTPPGEAESPGAASDHVITLVTTLLNPKRYPKQALTELYARPWQIETNLRHLKATMRMDVLRCQTVDGIHRELAVFGMVYNCDW